jgi:peroxiredoxin Q/BCP
MMRLFTMAVCAAAIFFGGQAMADDSKSVELKVGDKAPAFEGRTDEDKLWKSKDHVGKKVLVVYFYPADMTGGCTKQACNYRDAIAEMDGDEVEVVGVSGDSVENHQHFKKEHKLNFTLLADPEGKIAKAFGVKTGDGGVVNVSVGGKDVSLERGVTASRWTFVIDRDGKIALKDDKVDASKDTERTLKVVEKLAAKKK